MPRLAVAFNIILMTLDFTCKATLVFGVDMLPPVETAETAIVPLHLGQE